MRLIDADALVKELKQLCEDDTQPEASLDRFSLHRAKLRNATWTAYQHAIAAVNSAQTLTPYHAAAEVVVQIVTENREALTILADKNKEKEATANASESS